MRKNKAKSASAKRGSKKSVKIKDLPVKDKGREVLGGQAAPNSATARELENRNTLGGGTMARPDALNLGL